MVFEVGISVRPMFGMFFHQLNLTDAQKAQVKQIMSQEQPTLKPLMQQMAQGENQMRTLELSGTFDEGQARTLATQQSQNMTELMVQRARIESEVIQVLTPDQKTKLSQLVQQRAQRFADQNPSAAHHESVTGFARSPLRQGAGEGIEVRSRGDRP